jgi:tetratricopeptide (TPR) repeat protein
LLHLQRATELFRQGRLADATRDLERAVDLKPDLVAAHRNLAIAYAETCSPARRLTDAIRAAEMAVRLAPNDAVTRQLVGDLYRQAGQYEQATAALREGLRLDPKNPALHEALGDALATAKQDEAAQAARQMAIALRQPVGDGQPAERARQQIALGDAYLAAGEYDKALGAFQAALELDPTNPAIRRGLGLTYYWKSDWVASEREYREWVRAVPMNGNAHLILGLLLAERGRVAEAISELETAVKLPPCNAVAHLALARLYWQQGDQARAEAALKMAQAIEPRSLR